MKQPSRHMPKIEQPRAQESTVANAILFVIILGIIWMFWKSPYLLWMPPPIFITFFIRDKRNEKKAKTLVKKGEKLNIFDFAKSFDCRTVDTWIIRAVYEQLQECVKYTGYVIPIKAEDDIFQDLGVDSEEFELEIIDEIAQRTDRSLDNTENNPYYNKINTVHGLVYFFNEQPLKSTHR